MAEEMEEVWRKWGIRAGCGLWGETALSKGTSRLSQVPAARGPASLSLPRQTLPPSSSSTMEQI